MDEIYASSYDVKRIEPGRTGPQSRGWLTHDCTTLGANSGSVVLDLKSTKAVGLHFAGLHMIENYAVPAALVASYLRSRPWHPDAPSIAPTPSPGAGAHSRESEFSGGAGEVTLTMPLTITVSPRLC
jgi:hypothetical protein